MLLLAHRGASADAPENTLEAFEEAIRQGADGVELDAMVCGTGEVVVCHDERLDRLAGLDWEVLRTPWAKLKDADVGSKAGRAFARIPLLEDVLGTLPRDTLVNVELKCETLNDHGLTASAARVIQRSGSAERIIVSSFNAPCLWRLAALAPALRRGYLIDPDRSWWLHGQVLVPLTSTHSVHPEKEACTPSRIAGWHASGLRVAVWTVDDGEEARRFREFGVEYLITNRPGAIRRSLEPSG